MKIVKAGYEILTPVSENGKKELMHIENIARTCYKSVNTINDFNKTQEFIRNLITNGHEAMLEHSMLAVKFIVDRGVSHELVRHRVASFAQESTRYCNYSKDKFNNELTFIDIKGSFKYMDGFTKEQQVVIINNWNTIMIEAENAYMDLTRHGVPAQVARSILPNSLKTEINITANYREWRNIFRLRIAPSAHPQMREVMIPLFNELQNTIPVIFDDLRSCLYCLR